MLILLPEISIKYKYLLRVTLLDFQLILDTKKVSLFYFDFAILLEGFF